MGGEDEDRWARGGREAWAQRGEDLRPQGGNLLVDSEASGGRAPPSAALEELQGVGRRALEWGRIFHPELAGNGSGVLIPV